MPARAHRPVLFPAPATTGDEDLLSMEDAARRLGLKPDTLKKMARCGQIKSVKYPKLRRFEPQVLRDYIAKHRQG